MKIALVHDWLNTRVGGSEKVLMEFADLFPEAPIYTLLFRPEYYPRINPKRVITSPLSNWPKAVTERPRYLLPFIPTAIESFDFSQFELVVSSSNAFSKGIITNPGTIHICYCHTPMRFAWDYWPRYLDEQNLGPAKRFMASRMISKLRQWDYYSAKRVDQWVANSKHVAKRINKYYGAQARVIYPPVALDQFEATAKKDDYYMTLATLTPYKKVDLAIAACNQLKRKLVVIGEGFDRPRLEAMAGPTVRFAGRVTDQERAKLLQQARGLLVPQEEDFGIAMVEALAAGTPVIAYGRGGATEIVDQASGRLYQDDSPAGLAAAIKQAEQGKFEAAELRKRANRFGSERFAKAITQLVEEAAKDGR